MRIIRSLLPILFMFASSLLGGAATAYHPFGGNRSYQSFINISLPFDANQVNVVCQDSDGLIWLGTKKGLYSYNGYDVHEYRDETGSSLNQVFAIVQVDDCLCLGTDRGLRWLDLADESFRIPEAVPDIRDDVRTLAMYDGWLWLGTQDNGLKRLSLSSGHVENMNQGAWKETMIYALEPAGGRLFVASYEHLSCYDSKTGERDVIRLADSAGKMVNSLLWDDQRNCVWVGTKGCLHKYDIRTQNVVWKSVMPGISMKTLSFDASGNLLMGTDAGLYVLDVEKNTHRKIVHDSRNARSLCNNIVCDILCDRNSNVWLATDRGISLAQADAGQNYIHLSELVQSGDGNMFTCMHKDSHGDYWFGGKNGLIRINGTSSRDDVSWFRQGAERYPISHNRVRHIYEDSTGDIWIATDGGVGRYDRKRDRFDFFQIQYEGRNADWAYSIAEDCLGRMWVAFYKGGLLVCDREDMSVLHHLGEEAGVGANVYIVQDDCRGSMWASTSNGLISVDIHTMTVRRHDIDTYNMLCLDGSIWYSLSGRLYRYDIPTGENTLIPFSETCSQIYSFFIENDSVWFTSSEGLFSIDPVTMTVNNVSHTADSYFCGLYDATNNEILLGGEDCVGNIVLDDKALFGRTDPVFITSVVSNGRQMRPDHDYKGSNPRRGSRIEFKTRTDVVLELSSCSYRSGETYYYRFDKDKQWTALGKGRNHISMVNPSGGTYTLQLSSTNPDLSSSAMVSEYSIYVPYPWYLDRKAFILYFLLLAGVVAAIIRTVHVRNRRRFELRKKEMTLELSNMKMDFFVNVSHELKTPLSLIIAPVSRMLSEATNARAKKSLTTIHDNALRLNTLIHKILDFRQMEVESEDVLIRSHVEVGSLLRNCVGIFSGVIEQKKISVNVRGLKDAIWADMDRLKIESAIINILSNAIKYVDSGTGVIDIEVAVSGGHLQITITDNGCGIDKDDLPLVFIRYFQGKGKTDGGNGIGLYLVKKYVELHGGTISIESAGGTKVKLVLPLEGDDVGLTDNVPENLEELSDNDLDRILIIDDNKEIVAFLAETLSQHYECRGACDGKEGLAVMENYLPDLIIVDEMMPEMDGLTFSRYVRKNYRTAAVPIIMLTAKDDMDTELKSIKAGVDVFMPKPFDIRKLQLRIAQLLQKKYSIEKSIRMEAVARPDFNDDRDRRSSDEIFLEKATRAIEDNMGREDFDVSLLAGMLSVENKQLYRKLKQLTGYSPVNYIRKLRMRKASILLQEDRFTVAEVMYLVGYSNSSYFSKCFAEEFGMTPKEFVLKNR